MCTPRVNSLALWYLGLSVHAHIKCREACPKNQVLWQHLCWADVPLLLSVTGHTWAVCVAWMPRSCLVLELPVCTQSAHALIYAQKSMVMLWRQSLLCTSYNLCILNNLHWKLSRRTNVLHPSIWNTWSLLCQMQSVICFHRNVRVLICWNQNVDSVKGKTLILIQCKLYRWAECTVYWTSQSREHWRLLML